MPRKGGVSVGRAVCADLRPVDKSIQSSENSPVKDKSRWGRGVNEGDREREGDRGGEFEPICKYCIIYLLCVVSECCSD